MKKINTVFMFLFLALFSTKSYAFAQLPDFHGWLASPEYGGQSFTFQNRDIWVYNRSYLKMGKNFRLFEVEVYYLPAVDNSDATPYDFNLNADWTKKRRQTFLYFYKFNERGIYVSRHLFIYRKNHWLKFWDRGQWVFAKDITGLDQEKLTKLVESKITGL